MTNNNKSELKLSEFKYSISMGLVGIVFGGTVGYLAPEPDSISFCIGFGILFGGFFFITTEHAKYLLFEKSKEKAELLKKIEQCLCEKTDKIITHAALFTTNQVFEEAMRPLYEERLGKTKWIVAKFISEKLSRHFKDYVKLKIEAVIDYEFSELTERMIPECENNIYLTNPYTPTEFFDGLQPILGQKREDIKNGQQLRTEDLAGHMRAVLASRAKDKRRLTILSKKKYEDYIKSCTQDRSIFNDLKEFIRLEKLIFEKAKFVLAEDLINYYEKSRYSIKIYDFVDTDYGIYDKHVLIEYSKTERNLYLQSLPPPELLEIFKFELIDIYKTTEDIEKEIRQKQEDIEKAKAR